MNAFLFGGRAPPKLNIIGGNIMKKTPNPKVNTEGVNVVVSCSLSDDPEVLRIPMNTTNAKRFFVDLKNNGTKRAENKEAELEQIIKLFELANGYGAQLIMKMYGEKERKIVFSFKFRIPGHAFNFINHLA